MALVSAHPETSLLSKKTTFCRKGFSASTFIRFDFDKLTQIFALFEVHVKGRSTSRAERLPPSDVETGRRLHSQGALWAALEGRDPGPVVLHDDRVGGQPVLAVHRREEAVLIVALLRPLKGDDEAGRECHKGPEYEDVEAVHYLCH